MMIKFKTMEQVVNFKRAKPFLDSWSLLVPKGEVKD
jgi:hypothetical protein